MKKILLLASFVLILFSCSQKKIVESTYENGQPKVVKYYQKKGDDLILKREVVFYDNEQKKMEGPYKNQSRDGKWKAWYESGILWSEGEYKEGKRNGLGTAYYENGKKHIEGMYRNDQRVGMWQFYDTTGKVVKEIDFDKVPSDHPGSEQ